MRLDRAIAEALRKWTGVKTASVGSTPDRHAASGRSRGSTAKAYPAAAVVDPVERPELADEPPKLEAQSDDVGMPSSMPFVRFTGVDREIQGLLARQSDLLTRAGIDIDDAEQLGAGAKGVAFGLTDGRVIKVTTDKSEARASRTVQGKRLKHVVRVEDVFRFQNDSRDGDDFYGIVQERLQKLSPTERRELDAAVLKVRTVAPLAVFGDWAGVRSFVERRFPDHAAAIVASMERFDIDAMVDELGSAGVLFKDYHSGNIMRRGGDYVVTDLGISESPAGGGQIRTLEHVIRDVLMEKKADMVGLLVTDLQPPDKEQCRVLRRLAQRFTKLVVVLQPPSGQDAPFSYDLRRDMLKASLPDVESRFETYEMRRESLPEIISRVIEDKNSSAVDVGRAVTVLVAPDQRHTVEAELQGSAEWYDPELYTVETVSGFDGRGADIRRALVDDDVQTVRRLVDPHALSDADGFMALYGRMRQEAVRPKNEALVREFLSDVGGVGAVKDVLAKNAKRLLSLKHIDVRTLKRLGTGSNGTAYRMSDRRVFKVTSDVSEAAMANAIKGKDFKHIYRIYDTFMFPQVYSGHHLYGIVQEEDLRKLTAQERDWFDWLVVRLEVNSSSDEMADAKLKTILSRVLAEPTYPDEHKRDILTMVKYFGLHEIMAEVKRAGIRFYDYHSGNIMKRADGDFVLIDLGTKGTPSHAVPPTLGEAVDSPLFGSAARSGEVTTNPVDKAGGEPAFREILQINSQSLLDQKGIDVKRLQTLGKGAMGVAFRVDGSRALKLTTDKHEAGTSYYLQHRGRNMKHVVHVDDTFSFGRKGGMRHDVWGIVQELLEPLSAAEAKEFDDYIAYVAPGTQPGERGYEDDRKVLQLMGNGTWDQIVASLRDRISSEIASELSAGRGQKGADPDRVRKRAEAKSARIVAVLEKYRLDEIVRELRSIGIRFYDFHSGNLMKRGSDYVITDLGRSRSPGTGEPPVFEIAGAFIGGNLGGTAVLGPRAQSSQWSMGGNYNPDLFTNDDDRRRRDDRFSHEEPKQAASSLEVDDLIAMELRRLKVGR